MEWRITGLNEGQFANSGYSFAATSNTVELTSAKSHSSYPVSLSAEGKSEQVVK